MAGVLKSAAEVARGASGCFGAQVASSDREPSQVVMISRWESEDAMKKFHSQPDYASLERTLDSKPKVELFTTA